MSEYRNKYGVHFIYPVIGIRADVQGQFIAPIWPRGMGPYPLSTPANPFSRVKRRRIAERSQLASENGSSQSAESSSLPAPREQSATAEKGENHS